MIILNSNIEDIFSDDLYNHIFKNKYDLVMGGPPCQGFSTANRQSIADDPRNVLYKYFLKFVERTKPRFVLIENVLGIKNIAGEIVNDLDSIGYHSDYKAFQASDYGVPQNRRRVFFFGNEKSSNSLSNIKDFFNYLEKISRSETNFVLKDALYGLRSLKTHPKKNDTKNEIALSGHNIEVLSEYNPNKYLEKINFGKVPSHTYNHKARYNNERDVEIFRRLPQGGDSMHESIRDIMPYKRRDKIFKDKYYKLVDNKHCKAITSHMKFDCNMYIHPRESRGLTPREAARVQSFSDDFFFVGPISRCYMQIGNAVPPLMARHLCHAIEKLIS